MTMGELLLPAGLVGTVSEVEDRIRRQFAAFMAGGAWNPFNSTDLVKASSVGGLIVLSGPAPLLADAPHVQAYLPLGRLIKAMVDGRVSRQQEDEAVAASLRSAWGVLGLLAPPNQMLVYPAERHRIIAEGVAECWNELDGVGARYSIGLPQGARLWSLPTNLQFVLSKIGIDVQRLAEPLPEGKVHELLASRDGGVPG